MPDFQSEPAPQGLILFDRFVLGELISSAVMPDFRSEPAPRTFILFDRFAWRQLSSYRFFVDQAVKSQVHEAPDEGSKSSLKIFEPKSYS